MAAEERKALVVCAFIAGAVMVPTLDLAAVAIDVALGLGLLGWHQRALRREAAPAAVARAGALKGGVDARGDGAGDSI